MLWLVSSHNPNGQILQPVWYQLWAIREILLKATETNLWYQQQTDAEKQTMPGPSIFNLSGKWV
jgi:hypothetical protein